MPSEDKNPELIRLRELAMDKCAGALTEEGTRELGEMLSASTELRNEYLAIQAIHAKLDWDLGGDAYRSEALTEAVSEAVEPAAARRASWASRVGIWVPAIAACLLIGLTLGRSNWLNGPQQPTIPQSVVGRLTPVTASAKWSFTSSGATDREAVYGGDTIWLEEGAVDLRFQTDTIASLEAPMLMHVLSPERVRVIQGGIKVEVAKGAEGFAVETESAEVVDLGTVFSVSVDKGATDLVVFDGEVDLKVGNSQESAPTPSQGVVKRLRAGEAVQVSRDGTLSRIVNVRQSPSAGAGTNTREPLVASVRDNILRDDFYNFYEIVPSGMGEDANAFVDRPHEWNGVNSAGMPSYLLGGDYVKTFNDDKVVEPLSIELKLTRPATVYVLLDERLRPPAWLVNSFEQTGDRIGVDEVHFNFDAPQRYSESDLQEGAGASVNREHLIWKRVVPSGGVVQLGANGELIDEPAEGVKSKANMYGIVAAPLGDHP